MLFLPKIPHRLAFLLLWAILPDFSGVWAEEDALIVRGFDASVLDIPHPELRQYSSNVNFPAMIGWDRRGRRLLFNGGRYLYSMKRHDGKIRVQAKLDRTLSSYLSPDRKRFVWLDDQGGDENYQLSLYEIRSKRSAPLTRAGARATDPFWSPDSRRIAFKSNERDPAQADLYVLDVEHPERRRLLMRDISDDGVVYDWSTTGQLWAVRVISENHKQLFRIGVEEGTIEQLHPDARDVAYADAQFLPDGRHSLVVSDAQGEFLNLMLYDMEAGTSRNLTGDLPWDVDALAIDPTGSHAVFTVNADGTSQLYLLDLKSGQPTAVDGLPRGVVRNLVVSPDGSRAAFNLYGTTFRRKVFSLDLKTKALRQWTQRGETPVDTRAFSEPTAFRYPSRDATTGDAVQIPAFIHRPHTPATHGHPVLIEAHGGPEYQMRPTFNRFHQYLVQELGLAVIVPNVRGSFGYGKSYLRADDGRQRENAIDDIGALLDWIGTQPDLDASRVGLVGESYGGYVVLASLAAYPERIRCGIDVVGISNWIDYLKGTADYRRDLRRVEFGDERIPEMREFLERISPTHNAGKIRSPLMIVHGRNDPRVDYRESERIFSRLEGQGTTAWYLLATNEGHGFHRSDNFIRQRNAQIVFLQRYLLGIGSAAEGGDSSSAEVPRQ